MQPRAAVRLSVVIVNHRAEAPSAKLALGRYPGDGCREVFATSPRAVSIEFASTVEWFALCFDGRLNRQRAQAFQSYFSFSSFCLIGKVFRSSFKVSGTSVNSILKVSPLISEPSRKWMIVSSGLSPVFGE